MHLPPNHQSIIPYLIVKDADGFIAFIQKVFQATENAIYRREDNTIQHAEYLISGHALMLGESGDQWQPQTAGLYVYMPDAKTTYDTAVTAGCAVLVPYDKMEYGYMGGVLDAWGNSWWITQPE